MIVLKPYRKVILLSLRGDENVCLCEKVWTYRCVSWIGMLACITLKVHSNLVRPIVYFFASKSYG